MINFGPTRYASMILVLLFLAGCGGGKSASKTAENRPSANPPLYRQTDYNAETGWDQDASDKRAGNYLESVWHDPASVSSRLVIDSRNSEGTAPPLAAAELSRIQTTRLPGYRERSFKKVKIGGHPAVRWAYGVGGEEYIEYFFAECGTSIIFHGSTSPIAFEPFSRFYGIVASRVKIVCDG